MANTENMSNGSLRVPGRGSYTEEARRTRLEWLRELTQTSLAPLGETRLESSKLSSNIENLIGAVEVPVGIAGPLLFHGRHAEGMVCAPLATSEGTLVASVSRGAAAITRSGGVRTCVVAQRMNRVPAFRLNSLTDAVAFAEWINGRLSDLRGAVGTISRHAVLTSISPVVLGRIVHVEFAYETGDAAGQNMTSACTWQACQWILEQFPADTSTAIAGFLIEGNMSGDKKVTHHSFISGRGNRVIVEADLNPPVLEQVLNITPSRLLETYRLTRDGGIQSGMIGYAACVANVIGAMFTALGQDIASVHESSLAHLSMEPADNGVRATLVLPSLIVATVGGGTHLPAQQALLEMLGCPPQGGRPRLAEIVGGFCLALELSTISAVATDEFVAAHERLGRNRPDGKSTNTLAAK